MNRPVLVAVEEGESRNDVEDLEAEVIQDLMTAAAKGADRLPSESPWRATCVEVQRTCARSLRRRGRLLALLGSLPVGSPVG